MTKLQKFNGIQEEIKELQELKYKYDMNGEVGKKWECSEKIEELNERLRNEFDWVSIECWIGYRQYFYDVIKIGKGYFHHGKKMTKSRGWHSITEIPEITERMRGEMISDMYYY